MFLVTRQRFIQSYIECGNQIEIISFSMRDLRLIWSKCLNPILKWKNRGRSRTPWVNRLHFVSPHASNFLDHDWSKRGIKTWSVCWDDHCKMSNSYLSTPTRLKYQSQILYRSGVAGVFDSLSVANKQLYGWSCPSIRPSLRRQSVTSLSVCSCHHIIMKFSGIITTDKRDVRAKKVKVEG